MNIKGILFISFILLVFSLAAVSASDLGHVAISDSHSDSSIAHVPVTVPSHDDSVIIDENLDDVAVDDPSIDDGQSVPDDDSTIDDGDKPIHVDPQDDVDGDINDDDSIIINITNDTSKNNYNDKPISNVKVDGESFDELQSLVDLMPNGATLFISHNYKGAKDKHIAINKDLVIDGQGYTIDCAKKCRAFYSSSGNIVLKDLNIIKGHYDTFSFDDKTNNGGAIWIGGTAKYTLINCNFRDNWADDSGGAIYNEAPNALTIINCLFKNNTVEDADGGAIYSKAPVYVKNSTFENNQASRSGGAIGCSGNVSIADSKFNDNKVHRVMTDCSGGAICVYGNLSINNSTFNSNGATIFDSWGGAIYTRGNVYITNCTFDSNYADDYGGAIYANYVYVNEHLQDSQSHFINNKALSDKGGAIYAVEGVYGYNADFISNNALVDGGAIFSHVVDLENCSFYYNRAEGASSKCYGGAVRAYTAKVFNCIFRENYSENHGGAIFTNTFSDDVKNCTFYFNQAGEDGGAVYINNENEVLFTQCTFIINRCLDQGGAIYADSCSAEIGLANNLFKGNHAETEGHVVFNYGYFGEILNNWWADNIPTEENGLLVEHKYCSSNINHVDSNPLRLAISCPSVLVAGKVAFAELYFVKSDGSEFTGEIPVLMEFVLPADYKMKNSFITENSILISFIPQMGGIFTISGNLFGEVVSVTSKVTGDSSFAGNSVASGFADSDSSMVKNAMVNTHFVKSLCDFSQSHDDFNFYSPWLLILSIFGVND